MTTTKRKVGTEVGDQCECVVATGYSERMESDPDCPVCDGEGIVGPQYAQRIIHLETLNGDIDELSSDASDCASLCPQAKTLLDLAWYFTEAALRETRGTCSAGCDGAHPKKWCCCCAHFAELAPKANGIKSRL